MTQRNEFNMARCANMFDDTRRLLLKVRQGLDHDSDLYLTIKSTINNLGILGALVKEGDSRFNVFDGVFFLRDNESEEFITKYRAHLLKGRGLGLIGM